MGKATKHIDDFFKDALFNYEENPPMESWDRIVDDLDEIEKSEQLDNYFKKSLHDIEQETSAGTWEDIAYDLDRQDKQRNLVFIYRIAAAIAFFIIIGSGYLYFSKQSKNDLIAVKNDINTENTQTKKEIYNTEDTEIDNITKSDILANNNGNTSSGTPIIENQNNEVIADIVPIIAVKIDDHSERGDQIAYLSPIISPINNNYDKKIKYTDEYIDNMLNDYSFITDNEEIDKTDLEWTLGGQFSPVFASRDIREKSGQSYAFNDENLLAYSGGLNINVQPAKRLVIQSGLYYSTLGQRLNDIGLYEIPTEGRNSGSDYRNYALINTTSGELYPDPNNNFYIDYSPGNDGWDTGEEITDGPYNRPTAIEDMPEPSDGDSKEYTSEFNNRIVNSNEIYPDNIATDIYNSTPNILNPSKQLKQTFEFIEIPILVKYKLIEQKIDFQIIGGFSTNLLIDNTLSYNTIDGNKNYISEQKNFSKLNYNSIIGIGLEYPLLSNLILNLEPAFKYQLNPLNESTTYYSHPYSLAVYSGISYKF